MKKYKVGFLISHPIQYQIPLFEKLAVHPEMDLLVLFCSDHGIKERFDPGFRRKIRLDIPIAKKYKYKIIKNYSPNPSVSNFWGLINPGIIKEIWRENYDAFIIHGYAYVTNWLAIMTCILKGTPVFFRGETLLRPERPWFIKFMKRLVMIAIKIPTVAYLSINSQSKKFYLYYGVKPEKIFNTPYAVDNERFKPSSELSHSAEEVKRNLNISERGRIIIFVGKLIPKKRPFDILLAYKNLIGTDIGQNFLVFIGQGELYEDLQKYVLDNNLTGVRFAGFVNQAAIPAYYAAADVFVLPSGGEEVSPLVINEAMAAGLPILISNAIPSASNFVFQGKNGFIYPVGDIPALSEYLKIILNQKEKSAEMRENSLKMIQSWNYDVGVSEIMRALHTALNY